MTVYEEAIGVSWVDSSWNSRDVIFDNSLKVYEESSGGLLGGIVLFLVCFFDICIFRKYG